MHLCCRCTMAFNQLFEYPLFTIFTWNMLTQASLFIALQFQLVEYKIPLIIFQRYLHSANNFFWKYACFLFPIFKWADHVNSYNLAILILLIIWLSIGFFLLCELGARMTNQFKIFDDELGRCDWYVLPIEQQQMYLIFRSDAQRAVNIYCFGGIICERATYKMVMPLWFRFGGMNNFLCLFFRLSAKHFRISWLFANLERNRICMFEWKVIWYQFHVSSRLENNRFMLIILI